MSKSAADFSVHIIENDVIVFKIIGNCKQQQQQQQQQQAAFSETLFGRRESAEQIGWNQFTWSMQIWAVVFPSMKLMRPALARCQPFPAPLSWHHLQVSDLAALSPLWPAPSCRWRATLRLTQADTSCSRFTHNKRRTTARLVSSWRQPPSASVPVTKSAALLTKWLPTTTGTLCALQRIKFEFFVSWFPRFGSPQVSDCFDGLGWSIPGEDSTNLRAAALSYGWSTLKITTFSTVLRIMIKKKTNKILAADKPH